MTTTRAPNERAPILGVESRVEDGDAHTQDNDAKITKAKSQEPEIETE
jgi:hypothetical protein